jgi:hypothetical protein
MQKAYHQSIESMTTLSVQLEYQARDVDTAGGPKETGLGAVCGGKGASSREQRTKSRTAAMLERKGQNLEYNGEEGDDGQMEPAGHSKLLI